MPARWAILISGMAALIPINASNAAAQSLAVSQEPTLENSIERSSLAGQLVEALESSPSVIDKGWGVFFVLEKKFPIENKTGGITKIKALRKRCRGGDKTLVPCPNDPMPMTVWFTSFVIVKDKVLSAHVFAGLNEEGGIVSKTIQYDPYSHWALPSIHNIPAHLSEAVRLLILKSPQ